ncbi:MAG: hypothetical protein J2P47_00915 [Acetobacteraceae bacterium]|nr:hypothetical protein [Acetobacteraceae bacterium]
MPRRGARDQGNMDPRGWQPNRRITPGELAEWLRSHLSQEDFDELRQLIDVNDEPDDGETGDEENDGPYCVPQTEKWHEGASDRRRFAMDAGYRRRFAERYPHAHRIKTVLP